MRRHLHGQMCSQVRPRSLRVHLQWQQQMLQHLALQQMMRNLRYMCSLHMRRSLRGSYCSQPGRSKHKPNATHLPCNQMAAVANTCQAAAPAVAGAHPQAGLHHRAWMQSLSCQEMHRACIAAEAPPARVLTLCQLQAAINAPAALQAA